MIPKDLFIDEDLRIEGDSVAPEKRFLVKSKTEHKKGKRGRVMGVETVIVSINAVSLLDDRNALDLLGVVGREVVEEVDVPGVVGDVASEPRFEVRSRRNFGERAVNSPRVKIHLRVEYSNTV